MRPEAHEVGIPAGDGLLLGGTLAIPEAARGVVLFAHGSGSSRRSPRNRYVAGELQRRRLATLLMDLLTEGEEESEKWTRHLRFDIELLTDRLISALAWLGEDERVGGLRVGLFGSSTGAAAALVTAARAPSRVHAVVSRGGRPDLAAEELRYVRAPTLLVVGGADVPVLELNRAALDQLHCEKELKVVPGATHLFEEPGTLEAVANLAAGWFTGHLQGPVAGEPLGAL